MLSATSFISDHQQIITAGGVMVAGLVLVWLIERFLDRRAKHVALALYGGQELSGATQTRLTFLRRAAGALVIVVALAIALSQFDALNGLGRTLLTSSAITAAVVGFAARQLLANVLAGVMLMVTQPLRIGDSVEAEGQRGTVEEIGLIYTWLRTGTDARILIPNERLAGTILRNDSIRSDTVRGEVVVWIGPDADEARALDALAPLGTARISDVAADGTALTVVAQEPVQPHDRAAHEGELRAQALRALREAGLRGQPAPQP